MLYIATILAWLWSIRAILWFGGHCIFVFLELFDDITRHRIVQCLVFIIPLQLDSTVEVAVPIFGDFVFVF